MATNGWIGEQTVHSWGSYNSRLTTNVYINGIRRYSDHIDVSGVIYLFCKSSGARTVWYDWAITAWCGGGSLGQIKPRTYNNNILGKSWSKNFSIRINCSNSATSATFQVGFSDSNMGGKDKYWTLYFDRYATSPSGITSVAAYTQYSTISTSCSGINWGQGYSNRNLTCVASYTYNGKTENFTLGTWTDGATSKSVTKTDFNFPADLNVTVKWTASTNIGSTSSTAQIRVKQTFPAPNLNNTTFTAESIAPYCIKVNVNGVDFGDNYSARKLELYGTYELDGIIYDNKLGEISNQTSWTLEYDASQEAEPWTKIPDDSSILLRLVADNGNRTSDKTIIINCQSSYEAYVIEHIPEEEKEKSETYTGKNIQIQNAPKDAPLADFKLDGETSQNGTPTPDAPVPVKVVTGENVVKITGKNLWGADEHGSINENTGENVYNANRWRTVGYIPVKSNTAYTLSSNASADIWYIFCFYDSGKNFISGVAVYGGSQTQTTPANCKFMRCVVCDTASIKTTERQLELGSATAYEPYQGQSYEVNLGKNLFDAANADVKTGYILNNSGVEVSDNTGGYTRNYSVVKPNTTYTISGLVNAGTRRIYYYDGAKNFISRSDGSGASSWQFTTPANCHYVNVQIYTNTDNSTSMASWQIEIGSQATDFADYFTPIELCKIGTYQDYIYKSGGKWYVRKEIGKAVLDGSEVWETPNNRSYSLHKSNSKISNMLLPVGTLQMICDYFTPSQLYDEVGSVGTGNNFISFNYDGTSSNLAGFKIWLANNNVSLYAPLATPTDTEITNEALIEQLDALLNTARTYAGTNNIFTITPNEQGALEIQYYTKWQNTSPAILSANGRNGTGNFKQVRRIGAK